MDALLGLVSTGDALAKVYGFTPTIVPLAAWPDATQKFIEAEEVAEMAKFIISKWRPDLRNIEIAYIFKQKASKSGENVTFGSAKTESDLQRVLHRYEAVVQIGFDTWIGMDVDQQLRLVDHELQHLGLDPEKGKLGIVNHPVEEFPEVVQRWGLGKDADVQFIAAYEKFKKDHAATSAATKV